MSYISVIITALCAYIFGLLKGRHSSSNETDEHIGRKIDALDLAFEDDEREDLADAAQEASEVADEIDSMSLEQQADEVAALLGGDK